MGIKDVAKRAILKLKTKKGGVKMESQQVNQNYIDLVDRNTLSILQIAAWQMHNELLDGDQTWCQAFKDLAMNLDRIDAMVVRATVIMGSNQSK